MSVFLYYIPGVNKAASLKKLNKLGLDPIFGPDAKFSRGGCTDGPDGKGGLIIRMADEEGPLTGYYKKHQVWRECKGYWVGFDKRKPPTPEGLMRPDEFLIDGHLVKLPGGRRKSELYIIPLARVFEDGTTRFPMALTIGPEGRVVSEPLEEYASFCKKAEKLWEQFEIDQGWEKEKEDVISMIFQDLFVVAVEALAINHHMGPEEVSLLKLIDTLNIALILNATFDGPRIKVELNKIMEEEKKKAQEEEEESASEECSISDGKAAS